MEHDNRIKIGNKYKSKTGSSIRTPLISNDRNIYYCLVESKSGEFYRWYHKNARQLEIEVK